MADDKRPLRLCDSCGQIDDHPRHEHVTAPEEGGSNPEVLRQAMDSAKSNAEKEAVLAAATDGNVVTKHMDCCAADGCPDGSCADILDSAKGKRGDDLVKHLTEGN